MIVSGWTFRRGRTGELDKNSPGTAAITLIDTTGELDPSGPAYNFAPGTPGAIAIYNPVTATDSQVFTGNISRFSYDLYPTERYAIATLELVDGLDRLARTEMYAGTGQILTWGSASFISTAQDGDVWFDADSTGNAVATRINSVLNSAQWPVGLRDLNSGNVSLKSTTYAYRTPALAAIQDAADAEFPGVANFYVAADGKAMFQGRLARFNPTDAQYNISIWRAGDIAAVNADSTRALIFELDYDEDVEKVINTAIATPKGIADADINAQRVEDAASITAYGSRSESFHDLLTDGDFFDGSNANYATYKFAYYYVTNYATPRVRVNRITVKRLPPTHPNAAEVWALMCGVDISDIIRLKTTHQAGGGFDEDFYVEGISATATSRGGDDFDDVEMTLDLSPCAYFWTNPGW